MDKAAANLSFHPLTPARWADFVRLFGTRGACGGCWCMYWRLRGKAFDQAKGAKNRAAMKALVDARAVPGILAYDGKWPVGWCSIGRRDEFPRLGNSRLLKPIDAVPVWSIVCLFVEKSYRKQGVSTALIGAAAEFAGRQGATVVEGYPYDYRDRAEPSPPPFVYVGLYQSFERAGFIEAARPSEVRAIMRRRL